MKRKTNAVNFGDHFQDLLINLKDQRKAETPREKATRRLNSQGKRSIIDAINDYARFKMVITFRDNPNKWVWLPSLDLYKGHDGEYYRDEWTGYQKLVDRIENHYYGRFVMAYIVLTTDIKPRWSANNYNYCVYSNYKDQKKSNFKGRKLNIMSFKEIDKPQNREYIVNIEDFIIKNKLGAYLNKT
ncbi:MAG: hypothetical protein HKN40_13190 [Winogradskyella sp.]|uniref:hypothetical protein n=1 Tax=Winogradskyella sp. TaxID=1883156 RepID=UPI00185C74B6|nr:hypothetical protein [Winogradskyella sp.]